MSMLHPSRLRPIRSGALVLTTLALSTHPSAQKLFDGTTIGHPHPAGYLTGDARKVVVGQLTDDATRDVAILQESEIVLLFAPDRQEWFKRSTGAYAGTFTDLAVLPGAAPGIRDTLLALCPEGLVRLEWDAAERVLVGHPDPVAADAWKSARLLQVVPGSAGRHHVAAVTASGDVVYAHVDAAGFVDGATVPASVDAVAFAALDFDGGGDVEYALDDGAGLRIHSATGALLHARPGASPAPRLLRLPEPSQAKDALVWATSLPSIAQVLTVVRSDGTSVHYESGVQLGLPAELALADYDGDGHLDLLGACTSTSVLWVLQNRRAAGDLDGYALDHTFDPAAPEHTRWFDARLVYGTELAHPPALAAGDLDGDGDADPVLAGHAESAGLVQVFLSDEIDEARSRPIPLLNSIWYDEVFVPGEGFEAILELTVLPPAELGPATHVRGAVWVQPDEASRVRTPSWTPFVEPLQAGMPVATGGHIGASTGFGGPELYHVQIQAVSLVGGVETWAGPAVTFWLRRDEMFADPETSGGYSTPPNIQPGGTGP
jgi:hypothetical protein